MKAVVQDRYGSPDVLRVEEIEKPALADDRVLVKVRAASLNALDWHFMTGEPKIARPSFGWRRPTQRVRGVDLAGVVEAAGKSVSRLKAGDEVFGNAAAAFAEYVSAPEDQLVTKPSTISFEEAAALPVAGVTALQGLRDKGGLRPGQRVLINGASGGVGTFAVQIAKALGAHVTAVCRTINVDQARSLGADEVIDYTKEDFLRPGQRYDLFFDIGGNRPFAECRRALTATGKLVVAGAARSPEIRAVSAMIQTRFGSQPLITFLADVRQQDLLALKELVEAGKLRSAIDRTYPLAETAAAMRYILEGHARGKIVITVS
jgi:NADPH:quinone reductase-like Zn-dependent oxidoreductase